MDVCVDDLSRLLMLCVYERWAGAAVVLLCDTVLRVYMHAAACGAVEPIN